MAGPIERLYKAVLEAKDADPASSRTARLLHAGRGKIGKEVAEEAIEVALEAIQKHRDPVVQRSADLLFNLTGARAKAAKLGYRGALYAWESTDTGEETTPEKVIDSEGRIIPVLCGLEEHHISADIAYAVWQYWHATLDDEFFLAAGAEILIETARFWASWAVLESDGHYHIHRVIGPDEYQKT